MTDSRYKAYVKRFGDDSWELDAIEPAKFRELIEGQINGIRNKAQWQRDVANEQDKIEELTKLADNYGKKPTVEEALIECRGWQLTDDELAKLLGELPKPKAKKKRKRRKK